MTVRTSVAHIINTKDQVAKAQLQINNEFGEVVRLYC